MTFDFVRICDSVEILPELSSDQALRGLQDLKKLCLELSRAANDIDPRDAQKAGTLIPLEPDDHVPEMAPGPRHTLLRLVHTPRLLKACARHTYDTWRRLHGEVDFDDLLVSELIRTLSTQAFSFLTPS
jgi:hypothetical protein